MKELIGKDLSGWRLEIWYELRLSYDEYGKSKVNGYFSDKSLATASGKGKGFYGCDGTVADVVILTCDGKTGYMAIDHQILLSDQENARAEAIKAAKAKLTAEQLHLLGVK